MAQALPRWRLLTWERPAAEQLLWFPSPRPEGASPGGDLPSPRLNLAAWVSPSVFPLLPAPSLLPLPLADFLAREAQFLVTIGNIRGVLDSSVLDPEPGPQGPFISYSYYVTYDFVEDEEGEGSEYGGVLAEVRPLVPGRGCCSGPTGFPAAAVLLLE